MDYMSHMVECATFDAETFDFRFGVELFVFDSDGTWDKGHLDFFKYNSAKIVPELSST